MSDAPTVKILYPEVPGVVGGTERLAEFLRKELVIKGFVADILTLPFRWEPKEVVIGEALAWRMLDVDADMVVPLKFPAYFVKHPRKVPWLQHQYRQIYDFFGTPFSGFSNNLPDGELREKLAVMDTMALSESAHIFTNSANTLSRLQRFNGLDGSVLHIPPFVSRCGSDMEYGDFILAVGRLEEVKRFDLLIRAVAGSKLKPIVKIVGTGSQSENLQQLSAELGIADRIEFLGFVADEELAELYASCRFVHFAPKDEDFGLIAVEAMSAGKAVVTATDSGGPLEFVRDGENGFIAVPEPEAQSEALDRLWADTSLCKQFGQAALKTVELINWDKTTEELCRWLP